MVKKKKKEEKKEIPTSRTVLRHCFCCDKEFTPELPFQVVCSDKCGDYLFQNSAEHDPLSEGKRDEKADIIAEMGWILFTGTLPGGEKITPEGITQCITRWKIILEQ